ncbi:hypothetical protein BD311DRAFT_769529 [Dichomitus squalens]|uniref:DUF8212 domain-containing protein n=1 Tax=Dichomitus squalens TaxID=114155 RepID=A0A4Q9MAD1_9APHY|nr:hypothetical protein BD311DRAFT_769529 [Dichomitus squalens]
MYAWYSKATVCFAFLHDVPMMQPRSAVLSRFRQSVWFTRGWTLQELIAPRRVIFVSAEWRTIGDKSALSGIIEEITGIDGDILRHSRPLHSVSVARRMSWAARRVTTRKEDEAYSLLGIFGVNIAPIYGEGDRAFIRLQEEILARIPDQSIFAWNLHLPLSLHPHSQTFHQASLFALSPAWFLSSGNIYAIPREELSRRLQLRIPPATHSMTSYGIRTVLPIISITVHFHLAILACQYGRGVGRTMCLMLKGDFDGILVPISIAGIDRNISPADFVTASRPRIRPFPRLGRIRLTHADIHINLTPSEHPRLVEVHISRGLQPGFTREIIPPILLHPSGGLRIADTDHLATTQPAICGGPGTYCGIRLDPRSESELKREGYGVSYSRAARSAYLPDVHTFAFHRRRCSISISIFPCPCSREVPRSGSKTPGTEQTMKSLALSLTVTVTFPLSTYRSKAVPITISGDAFDPDGNYVPVAHDWRQPCHRKGPIPTFQDTFTSQEFSFKDSSGPRAHPFLELQLDRDAPQGTHASTTFTLAAHFNAEPRPMLVPLRWHVPGPTPCVITEEWEESSGGLLRGRTTTHTCLEPASGSLSQPVPLTQPVRRG